MNNTTISRIAFFTVLALCASNAYAQKMKVQVLQAVPNSTSYHWVIPGQASSSCRGDANTDVQATTDIQTNTVSGTTTGTADTNGTADTTATANCEATYTPAQNFDTKLHGADIKLLLPDGRIVLATCKSHSGYWARVAANMAHHPDEAYSNCSVPQPGGPYPADFHGNKVVITGHRLSINGKGKKVKEDFYITGILQPQKSQESKK